MSNLFIYFLIDPRDSHIKYVGQTRRGKKRLRDHLRAASNPSHHGMRKLYNWIAELQRDGLDPEFRVVEYAESADKLDEAETYWGEFCIQLGCPLKNVAPFGSNGKWCLSPDGIRAISIDRAGELHHFFGKRHRIETIELMRKAHVGKKWTREQIEKRAQKRRKPFICVETGEVFDSIGDFVAKGKGSPAVKRVLCGQQETINGFHYRRI